MRNILLKKCALCLGVCTATWAYNSHGQTAAPRIGDLIEARVVSEHWDDSGLFLYPYMASSGDQAFVVASPNALTLLDTGTGQTIRTVPLKPPPSCKDQVGTMKPVLTANRVHAYWASPDCGLIEFNLSNGQGRRLAIHGVPAVEFSALSADERYLYAAGGALYQIDLSSLEGRSVIDFLAPKQAPTAVGCDLMGNGASYPDSITVKNGLLALTSFETVALFSLTEGKCLASARNDFPNRINLDDSTMWYRADLPGLHGDALYTAPLKVDNNWPFRNSVAFTTRLSSTGDWPPSSADRLGQTFRFGDQVAVAYYDGGKSSKLLTMSEKDRFAAKGWACDSAFGSFFNHGSGIFTGEQQFWSITESSDHASTLTRCSVDPAGTTVIGLDVPGIRSLVTLTDGHMIGAFGPGGLRVIDLGTGRTHQLLDSDVIGVTRMSDGLLLLALGDNGVGIWSSETGNWVKRYKIAGVDLCQARDSGDGSILAVGKCNGQGVGQQVWSIDLASGGSRKIVSHSASDVYRHGSSFYVADRSNHIIEFHYDSGRLLGIIALPYAMALGFAPSASELGIVTYSTETGPSDEKGWISIKL